ncbi:hypothetical protein [Brassicibacter mesophilus]|uniref:hypothetical protein n=1 Tax=Brassicibacter mesophilus TaxID=745119 RepID=UPI003D2464FF
MNVKSGFNKLVRNLRVKTGYNYKNKESSFYRKQLNKIFICILIVLVILVLKKIDVKFSNNAIRIVQDTLDYSTDIKEDSIKVLKFVKEKVKIPNEIISVFKNEISSKAFIHKYCLPI